MNSCPKCGSTHISKIGFKETTKGRFQQYVCSNKHRFTGHEKFHHASEEVKSLAVKLSEEGLSMRAIARIVNVFPKAVELWLKKKAYKL